MLDDDANDQSSTITWMEEHIWARANVETPFTNGVHSMSSAT